MKLSDTEEDLVEIGYSNGLGIDEITEKLMQHRERLYTISNNNLILDYFKQKGRIKLNAYL